MAGPPLVPGANLDFMGPAFFVRIYGPSSNNIQVIDPQSILLDDPTAFDATRFVTSLEMEFKTGGFSFATVEIAPPIQDALELLDSPYIADGNIMLIQFGYPESGDTTDVFALRTTPAAIKFNGTRASITFFANGDFHFDSVRRVADKEWLPGNPGTAFGIANQIAQKYGWKVAFAPTQLNPSSDPVIIPPQLMDPINQPLHQVESDFDFLETLLMSKNCVLGVETSTRTLIIQDFDAINDSTPILKLGLWGQMDIPNRVYPLKSFDVDPQIYFQAPQGIRARVRTGPDQVTGAKAPVVNIDSKTNPQNVPAQNGVANGVDSMTGKETTTPEGPTVAAPPPYGPGELGKNYYKPARDAFKSVVDLLAKDSTYFSGIQGVAKTIGNPLLRIDQLLVIDGLGDNFSGPWKINRLVHQINSSGFETSMDLLKSSVSVEPEGALALQSSSQADGAPAPRSNTKTADSTSTTTIPVTPKTVPR